MAQIDPTPEKTFIGKLGGSVTVRGVLGHDVTLQEVDRRGLQGGDRSDLVRYHAYIGEAYIGELDSYWVHREDSSRSTTKGFAGTYPGAKDWGPSGLRADVLQDMVKYHLERERKALEHELTVLEGAREAALQKVVEIQTRITESTARLDTITNSLKDG